MKKNLFIMILCACALSSLSFYSCSQESTSSSQGLTNAKSYTVHLGLGGEITDISTSPLTKAAVADSNLYGIQVYSCPATSSSSPTYTQYAYGLFNDKSAMTVNLLQGYIYKFACTMVVNGKNKLLNYGSGYYYPFWGKDNTVQPNNLFTYSTGDGFSGLARGSSFLSSNRKIYDRPNIDRYYGELTGFTPAENASASISMKRVAFGAKFIADGLTDGKLKISMQEAPDIYITYPDTTVQDIFTFYNNNYYSNPMSWTQDGYSETVSTSITWIKADGATIPLATQDITFKRNMLTTITVKVNDTSSKNGIDINQETTSMGDGGSVIINSNPSGNTTVNP